MKYFIQIVITVGLISNQAFAQKNLESGFIIKQNRDTIQGFIPYEVDYKLIRRVNFHDNNVASEATTYLPDQLLAFGFHTGRIFESVKVGKDSLSYFAKKISTGKIDLFMIRYKNTKDTKYHLRRNDIDMCIDITPPQESKVNKDGKQYSYSDNKYIGNINLVTEKDAYEKELENLKYRTKDIQVFIDRFNLVEEEAFPPSSYKDRIGYTIDATFGLPVYWQSEINEYRAAVYIDKTNRDKSNKIAYRMGMSFRYWKRKEGNYDDGSDIQKMIKIIPLGIRWQSDHKKVLPYAYAGLGLMYWQDINFQYENEVKVDEYNENLWGIIVNAGIGVKFKLGGNYLLLEYTPVLIQSLGFINIGYSF